VGIAVKGIAHNIAYNDNLISQANAEQLKRLMEGWNNLPRHGTWKDGIEMERLAMLDMLTAIMNDPTNLRQALELYGGTAPALTDVLAWNGKDWNIVFRKVNEDFDQAVADGDFTPIPSYNPLHYLTLSSRSEQFANHILALFFSAIWPCQEAFRRLECSDNLKQIQLAMFLYHAEHGTLPPAFSVDTNGKPLHSWRTLLLPWLGDASLLELHAQIRFDEPWDSDHNRRFHDTNIGIYRCPTAVRSITNRDGDSHYAVVIGDDLLFGGDGQGRSLESAGRYMLLVVERKEGICWMQPDSNIPQSDAELGISSRSSIRPIGGDHTGGANFALRNGSVVFISETMADDVFVDLVRGSAKEKP
jgi:hypothetical protein